ncbi:MAG: thiolase domain-containing protein, partial [Candidatus Geothermarchaeales archaeon]
KYGAMNPLAQFQREVDLQTVLKSPVVAWPLRLYSCCPITDGSASVILASEETARKANNAPIWIKGMGAASDTANLSKRKDYTSIQSTVKASREAYAKADVQPDSFDVACVHDCFTIAEILAYEDLGFCAKGEGGQLVEEGETYLGGRIPVNLDGGLKAKGHPIGATGCSMMVEITRQLRAESDSRQADMEKGLGLVHNVGGTGHTCYVTVLGREM